MVEPLRGPPWPSGPPMIDTGTRCKRHAGCELLADPVTNVDDDRLSFLEGQDMLLSETCVSYGERKLMKNALQYTMKCGGVILHGKPYGLEFKEADEAWGYEGLDASERAPAVTLEIETENRVAKIVMIKNVQIFSKDSGLRHRPGLHRRVRFEVAAPVGIFIIVAAMLPFLLKQEYDTLMAALFVDRWIAARGGESDFYLDGPKAACGLDGGFAALDGESEGLAFLDGEDGDEFYADRPFA